MALLKCDVCGGKIVVQAGGKYGICESCGANYTLERMREITSGIKVSITGTKEDVDQWKSLLNTYLQAFDFVAAESTVKKILEATPKDEYANKLYQKIQDWKFYEIKNGILIKYHGRSKNTEIPYGITAIEEYAFCNNSCRPELEGVQIPEGIKSIGPYSFENCTGLLSITIPKSVKILGECAFRHCTSLQKVTLLCRDAVIDNKEWDPYASSNNDPYVFEDCKNLKVIIYPEGAYLIDDFIGSAWNKIMCGKIRAERIAQGKCSFCGGDFRGLFKQVCSNCGRSKNY